ncbi:MAG: phosphoglycerate kinase [Parcubacteria group bacterium Gr01-1014_3]|nr:MAG: phosphoglycerate kinase [Parcubacteria group bacterium Gr01-1014_3]
MKLLSKLKKLPWKTCLLRVDFNINPTDGKNAFRFTSSLPTIKLLLKKGARVVLMSHRGRPRQELGIRNQELGKRELSLKPFADLLQKVLKKKVNFLENIPESIPEAGELFLLENLRFDEREEKNSVELAMELAKLGDFYVNDAFAVSHRANASVVELPKLLPAFAGLLLEKEIEHLTKAMKSPKKPLVLIFGGVKIEDKAPVIKNLLSKASQVLLGSGALNDRRALPKSPKIIYPTDWLSEENKAMDIGPLTVEEYNEVIKKAKTIIWNGPLGYFENVKYAGGSKAIAKLVAQSKAHTIVGGGETTELILSMKLEKKIDFLSTGGGAMLDFLAGKKLPGIEALG